MIRRKRPNERSIRERQSKRGWTSALYSRMEGKTKRDRNKEWDNEKTITTRRSRYHHFITRYYMHACAACFYALLLPHTSTETFIWFRLLTIQNRQLFTVTFYSVHIGFCHICVRCSFMQRNCTKCSHYDQSQWDKLGFIPCQFFCLQAVYFLVVLSMRWWNNICLAIINNNNEHILYEICWLFLRCQCF